MQSCTAKIQESLLICTRAKQAGDLGYVFFLKGKLACAEICGASGTVP